MEKNVAGCEIEQTEKSRVNIGGLFVNWWRERERSNIKKEKNM